MFKLINAIKTKIQDHNIKVNTRRQQLKAAVDNITEFKLTLVNLEDKLTVLNKITKAIRSGDLDIVIANSKKHDNFDELEALMELAEDQFLLCYKSEVKRYTKSGVHNADGSYNSDPIGELLRDRSDSTNDPIHANAFDIIRRMYDIRITDYCDALMVSMPSHLTSIEIIPRELKHNSISPSISDTVH